MMAINRYRLQALAEQGSRAAKLTRRLLQETDKLLSTLLLGNNLLNTASTALVTSITISWYGNNEIALSIATALVAMAIIIFAEITPKIIGAAHPEKVALPSSYVMAVLVTLFSPMVWFTNLFVSRMIKWLGLTAASSESPTLNMQELRSMVLESGHFIPQKPKAILLNLFELESLTVDDMMTPRSRMEYLKLNADPDLLRQQIATAHHNKLPVIEKDWRKVVGMLHVRHSLSLFAHAEFEEGALEKLLQPPYFIPSGSPAITQLQYFQEHRERVGLVVDEYGEVLGLITPEDILEELIGEFTSHAPHLESMNESSGGSGMSNVLVDGASSLRALNRKYGFTLPVTGPKTLNGLVLDYLQDIPEAGVSVRIDQHVIEIVQAADRSVKTARIYKLPDSTGKTGPQTH
jgi:Mg2+/Co2+ transporter CorB